VIADATRDAGFAPLVLDPIDFGAVYMQQLQARQQEQGFDTPPSAA
jgi:preprotein translocase subunit SecB